MSFTYDMDMNTSQQEPNHDDSGIGLLDDGLDASFASKMQNSLKPNLTHAPLSMLPQSIS
jgi:regulatory factor X